MLFGSLLQVPTFLFVLFVVVGFVLWFEGFDFVCYLGVSLLVVFVFVLLVVLYWFFLFIIDCSR